MKNALNVTENNLSSLQKAGKTALIQWLMHPGSFMQRLKDHQIMDASIQVLQEDWQLPEDEESMQLAIPPQTPAWIREVLIQSDKQIWMFARTVIPRETVDNEEELQHLKTRALGSVLFNNPNRQRSQFEYFSITTHSLWHKKIAHYLFEIPGELWARRSLFTLNNKSLLLMEVFFPEIELL